jgi:acyl carrier protein
MPDLDARLSRIFRAAFPELRDQAVQLATRDSVTGWDSIAALTLSGLIAEEFGGSFDLEEAAEWASYAQVRAELEKRLSG